MHSDGSHTVIKMEANAKKKISTLWRALPNSQHFFHVPMGHDFQKRDHLCLLYRLTGSGLLYTQLVLFPPPVSRWLHLSLHLSGHSPTNQALMSCGSRCSQSHITGPTMRQKAAEGLSKPQPVATLWFRYELEFFSLGVLYLLLGDSFLLSHCLLLVRLRYVSYYSWGNGKFKIKIEGSLFELDKNRHDIHAQATPSLFFLVEKLLELCRHSCIDRRFLKASFGV